MIAGVFEEQNIFDTKDLKMTKLKFAHDVFEYIAISSGSQSGTLLER